MRYEKSFEVDTSPARAFKVVSDPTNIPKYTPDIANVAVTRITPGLVGTQMRMMTKDHQELFGEVTEASSNAFCAFKTDTGRTIRWDIKKKGKDTVVTTTVDTEEGLDTEQLIPQMERQMRLLRSDFRAHKF